MTARKSASLKASKTSKAVAILTDAQREEAKREEARQNLQDAYNVYLASLGQQPTAGEPTTKTMFFGFIGSIATMVLGYAVGMQVAEWLALAAFWLTGWGYLAAAIYIIGIILSAVASIYAAGRVAKYLATGQYSDDMKNAGAWFKRKFTDASTAAKVSMAKVRGSEAA